ncbi:3'-5' exonuclease [Bacteroidales bacterium]|nr:3'-5' exonuclease [Bacteroidales bacterium]
MITSITKEEISLLETEEFPGRVIVVESESEADQAVSYLSGFGVLGFDTETRPAFKKGVVNEVSLIQLSTIDTCYLFRLNLFGFPPSLVKLLSSPELTKVGLSLRDDFTAMNRRMVLKPQGFEDLQSLAPKYGIEDMSLQKVYALLFNKKISKSQRLSNWDAPQLSESQKKYAALDAWACLKIYECLLSKSQIPSGATKNIK